VNLTTIHLQIDSKTFTAKVFDNESVQTLLEKMPMTVTMIELNRNEKYYSMPNTLPTHAEAVRTIKAGELMLYGSDTLVLFYKSFTTSYSYTRLGYIEDVSGLEGALGSGDVQVTFSLSKSYRVS
jgi:hypothetical protein